MLQTNDIVRCVEDDTPSAVGSIGTFRVGDIIRNRCVCDRCKYRPVGIITSENEEQYVINWISAPEEGWAKPRPGGRGIPWEVVGHIEGGAG